MPLLLREQGWLLRTHVEVFGARDQEVSDLEWLAYCGHEDLVVLTKDRRIRYRRQEISAVSNHGVKLFALASANLRAIEQAQRFTTHRQRIEDACLEDGPFIYSVQATRIVRVFPA